METKQEYPFRIGGIYKNNAGLIVRLCTKTAIGNLPLYGTGVAYANVIDAAGKVIDGAGVCLLTDGTSTSHGRLGNLLRGECDEQGRPIQDKPGTFKIDWESLQFEKAEDPNAAMIARDGPAKPAREVVQQQPVAPLGTKTNPHAAICALTHLGAVSHLLGSAGR